jgi:hypothetical protein
MAKASGSKNGVHYSIRSVTPAMAEEWLGRNMHNRNLSEGVVKQYAGAIKLRWRAGGAKPEPFPEIVSPEAAGQ